MRTILSTSLVLAVLCATALANTWHVSPTGNDAASGSSTAPWKTIQRASNAAAAGDTVIVHAGTYTGFTVGTHATAAAPITFTTDGTVDIDGGATADRDAIHVEDASYIVIEGFTVTNATRSGISAITSDHITVRKNRVDHNAKWGVFSAFCDDLLVENNEISNSAAQHGVYASNSADRPVIRNNKIWGNGMCGVHINGDISMGGDGVISNAVVEGNIITNNGTLGGSAINGDGIQNAVIRNNVLDGNHASGVSLYQIDGGQPSSGNQVINNTIRMASDARSAVNIQDGSTGNLIYNNILLDPAAGRGAIDICGACMTGTKSDDNAVVGRFLINGSVVTLAAWRSQTGNDASSFVATDADLFTSATDLSLKTGSLAIDKGIATGAPSTDVTGVLRPQGAGIDIGAYERCDGACVGGDGGGGGGGGGGSGDGGGSGSDTGSGSGSDGQEDGGTTPPDQMTAGTGGCSAGGGLPGAVVLVVFGVALRRRVRGV
ncbi:MAG TPA: right-handed parallel beta-helix repeat-containing protein [Kofleriaceae bacterium]|nr:right-handed parallel beta-helix repeat-containing protein [Kofleriaceae bacterium]